MTAGDEAIQLISSALVGAPKSMVDAAIKPIVAAVGERVAKSIPARVAARAVEAITPVTLPFTPANAAINAGVGVGLNEAMRGLNGQDTLLNYQDMLYNPEKDVPDAATMGAATGIGMGMFFGAPNVTKAMAEAAAKDVEHSVAIRTANTVGAAAESAAKEYKPISAGTPLPDQSTAMKPTLMRGRGMFDENAPIKATVQNAGGTPEDLQLVDALQSTAGTANRVEMTNNALNYGIFEGMTTRAPAFKDMNKMFSQLTPEDQMMLDRYVYAKQRASNTQAYMKSLDQQIDEASAKVARASMEGKSGTKKTAMDNLAALKQKRIDAEAETPETRSAMVGWSKEQVHQFIADGENNPKLQPLIQAFKDGSAHALEFKNLHGALTDTDQAALSALRDVHVPLQERKYSELENSSPMKRRMLLYKDRFFPKSANPDAAFHFTTASRNITGEGAHVNNPLPAMEAYKKYIVDTVRDVGINNARKDIIRRIDSLEGARGKFLMPHEFDFGTHKSTSISPAQLATIPENMRPNPAEHTVFYDKGKLEYWKWADEQNRLAMEFAPTASVPLANMSRKVYQAMTTGIGAPWFAPRNLIWDTPSAQLTKQAGRSLGLIDTMARKAAYQTPLEKPVNWAFDHMFDPTVFAATAIAVPKQLGLRAARALGEKIGDDLATHSNIFNAIAKSPVGGEWVAKLGTTMAMAFDNSALGAMSRNMSTSLSHLNDVTNHVANYNAKGNLLTGSVKLLFNSYKAGLESIHGATKFAFFESNYGRLWQQYEGHIPQAEINKLVQETRNLTGDMSRRSANTTIQKVSSVVPYLNATIQGTRHVLHSAMPSTAIDVINKAGGNILKEQNNRFWSQFITGIAIPSVGALTLMSNWPGAEDYWYNKVPPWKRLTGIPYPTPDALVELAETGKLPEFSSDKINIIPLPPELSMILHPVLEGMRFAGMLGTPKYSTPQPFLGGVKDVLNQLTSISTPPALAAMAAVGGQKVDLPEFFTSGKLTSDINPTAGGANGDMMTTNSNIPQSFYDAMGALLGVAPQIAMQSFNVGDLARQDGQSYADAVEKALGTASFEIKRRLPEMDTGLWNARERQYAYTPEAQYVQRTKSDLDPVIGPSRQLSVEKDSGNRELAAESAGLNAPDGLTDKVLLDVSNFINNAMNRKGAYKTAADNYTANRKLLQDLENSRDRMPQDTYNAKRNYLTKQQQEATRTQSQVLQQMEQQIGEKVGPYFQQTYGVPFTYKNLAKLVRQDSKH